MKNKRIELSAKIRKLNKKIEKIKKEISELEPMYHVGQHVLDTYYNQTGKIVSFEKADYTYFISYKIKLDFNDGYSSVLEKHIKPI